VLQQSSSPSENSPEAGGREACEYLQTGQDESFHFERQAQWNTCWHMIVISPVVSSMRSRQTGHVGSSESDGVGGGAGFEERCGVADKVDVSGGVRECEGEKGSLLSSGNASRRVCGHSGDTFVEGEANRIDFT
jgi:hypothetical protein